MNINGTRSQFVTDGLKRVTDNVAKAGSLADMMATLTESMMEIIYDVQNAPINVKVKRSEDAKQFPLLAIGKAGDTGYDLPAVFPYCDDIIEYGVDEMRHELVDIMGKTHAEAEAEMRESIILQPGQRALVPTGVHLELPRGYWAILTARSSTSKKMMIVPQGIIDEGYRGELFAQLINIGSEPVEIKHGDRYVQVIIFERYTDRINMIEVDELAESERGATGFGSTGQSVDTLPEMCCKLGEDPNNNSEEID